MVIWTFGSPAWVQHLIVEQFWEQANKKYYFYQPNHKVTVVDFTDRALCGLAPGTSILVLGV